MQVNCNAAIKLIKMSGEAASQRLVYGTVSLSVFLVFLNTAFLLTIFHRFVLNVHLLDIFSFLFFFLTSIYFYLTKYRYIFDRK